MDCSKVTPVRHCECNIPNGGWCEPHQVVKTEHYVLLCLTRWPYRRAWNECRGPGQNIEGKRTVTGTRSVVLGPGTELRRALGCGFSRRTQCDFEQMNRWGCDGCREHMELIVSWLQCPKMDAAKAERMVNIAIRRAEQKAGRE
jgi:hypothetical protein